MKSFTVQPVTTRKDRHQFLHLPWELYRGDPNWTPPLLGNQAELAGFRHHPFYETADSQAFLVRQGEQVRGRVLAIKNRAYDEVHPDEAMGFLGFFECCDDTQAAEALFTAAQEWLADKGCTRMRGPVNPSMNYECGMLVQNFSIPATFMMTYNPPYYPTLWDSCGFEGVQDLFSFFGHKSELARMGQKIRFVASEAVERFNIS
ncbi:MAG: N-acetyltransferase, partial [Planctomycetota bacterium]